MTNEFPICPYCNSRTYIVGGEDIYPHRQDLHAKKFYKCAPCSAWVGCHRGTTQPLGRIANAELRRLKSAAHRAFDPLWREKKGPWKGKKDRRSAYEWLAAELGIDVSDCHIGMFNEDRCRQVVDLIRVQE